MAFVSFTFVSCAGSQKTAVEAPSAQIQYPDVTVVSWSDFHSSIYEAVQKDGSALGGLPVFMAAVENAKGDGLSLLVDGGDMFQGAMSFNEAKGMGMVDVMNSLGIDVATYGNHEFDYGAGKNYSDVRGALREVVEASQFNWVNANVVAAPDAVDASWPFDAVKPYTIIRKGPYRIAVIGLLTPETVVATLASHVVGLEFRSPAETLKTVIPEVVSQNPDFIIVDAHINGLPEQKFEFGAVFTDVPFTEEVAEILALPDDILKHVGLFITGHSHTNFTAVQNGLPVIQSASNGRVVTSLTLHGDKDGLHVDIDSIKKHVLSHEPLDVACGQTRPELKPIDVGGVTLMPSQKGIDIIEKYESAMTNNRCERVGCVAEMMKRVSVGESALGNLMTDSMRAYYEQADIAVINTGGIRIDVPKGDLYRETLNALMPFDNYLQLVELSGADVVRMLKLASTMKHGTTQVAGIQYAVEENCKNPDDINGDGNIENWENNCLCEGTLINGSPIDYDKKYKLAISDFMLKGGDDHAGCFNSAQLLDAGPIVKEVILEYVKKQQACFSAEALVNPQAPRITMTSCGGKFAK